MHIKKSEDTLPFFFILVINQLDAQNFVLH